MVAGGDGKVRRREGGRAGGRESATGRSRLDEGEGGDQEEDELEQEERDVDRAACGAATRAKSVGRWRWIEVARGRWWAARHEEEEKHPSATIGFRWGASGGAPAKKKRKIIQPKLTAVESPIPKERLLIQLSRIVS